MKRAVKQGRAKTKAKTPRSTKKDSSMIQAIATQTPRLLLTMDEVAGLLGVHHDTVCTMHNTGKMPRGLKIGYRTVRFRRSDIEFWIEHGCKSAAVTKALKESEGK
jgi:excisionase family DNA binding protein